MSIDITNSIIINKPSYKEPVRTNLSLNRSKSFIENVEEYYKMDPKLRLEEVLSIIKSRFIQNDRDIIKAFKSFDIEDSGVVTKGELRRVTDLYCLPLTSNQFNSLLSHLNIVTKNGSVKYRDLINIINDNNSSNKKNLDNKLPLMQRNATTLGITTLAHQPSFIPKRSIRTSVRNSLTSSCSNRSSMSQSSSKDWNYGGYSIEEIIPILQTRIGQNPAAIVKAFQLFDFNSDHHIQSFRLKKVLENYCCNFSDQQFDKLISKFSHSQNGMIDYIEFLNNIGIPYNPKGVQKIKDDRKLIEIDSLKDVLSKITEIAKQEYSLISSADLEDLLVIFRKKLEAQFATLRKTFLTMDPKCEGHVSLEMLHHVLNQFVFPMSFNVFKQLMEKCSFKATGSISWLIFLNKFQDPQSKKLNGSTLPIKSEKKCNPVLGTNKTSNIDELLELLHKYINSNYPSFRDAFLQMNSNHNGKITKSEFLKVMGRFNFEISRDQAKAIFSYLDPNSRGYVSYHHFLQLFEQKENLAAHKWLNSNHKVYEVKQKVKMSDDTIKSTLTQNITEKWPRVINEFKVVDHTGTGYISVENLKKTFEKLFGYLSSNDVDRLVANITLKDSKGRINYLELFNLLNVDPSPTDLEGLSTQITKANDSEAKERHNCHLEKMNSIDKNAETLSESMSVDEIIVRMKDHLLQNRANSYDIFRRYECNDKAKGMSRGQFKIMIKDSGYSISDNQFHLICDAVNFPKNKGARVDYNWFAISIMDDRQSSQDLKSSPCFLPESNHHVNAIRGEDGRNIASSEVESLLRQTLMNKFSDLRSAYQKIDLNNKGYLTKEDLKRFIDSFLILINKEDFNNLCEKLNIIATSKLSYSDFLDRFQIRDDFVEGHKWLQSKHKFNETSTNEIPIMSAEEVYNILPDKIHQTYQFISPTFAHIATSGTGYIMPNNLKELLNKLQINITKDEIKKLWKMYDINGNKKLDFNDFLRNMNLSEKFNSGDFSGPSSQIIQNSHDTIVDHLAEQEIRHQQSTDNQSLLGRNLHVQHIFEIVKRHIRSNYLDTATAFKSVTSKRSLSGVFKLEDLNSLLTSIHLFITNDKFIQLAARMGFEGPKDSLNYERFCAIFQDKVNASGIEDYAEVLSINNQEQKISTVYIEEAGNMTNNQISSVIARKVIDQYAEIEKTFLAMDTDNSGYVTIEQFKNLINAFCLSLTNSQFRKYLKSLSCNVNDTGNSDQKFDFKYFLNCFNQSNSNKRDTLIDSNETKLSMESNTKKMSSQRVLEYIIESIKARPKLFLSAFKLKDYADIGMISKADTKDVVEQYIFNLSNQDFEKFWTNEIKNEFDNINYRDMVKSISGYPIDEKVPVDKSVNQLHNCLPSLEDEDSDEIIRINLEKVLNKHWQNIFSKCKALDKSFNENNGIEGSITIEDFIKIISEYDPQLSPEKLASMNLYRTCKNGKHIRYGDLIRSVVLSSRGSIISQENMIDVQKKFINIGIKIMNSDNTKNFFPQIFKLRRRVLDNWKDLRKQFLQFDKNQVGAVNGNIMMNSFKSVCGQLSPDLFYHLMTLYDVEKNGSFHYDKFIEDFLKTT